LGSLKAPEVERLLREASPELRTWLAEKPAKFVTRVEASTAKDREREDIVWGVRTLDDVIGQIYSSSRPRRK